MRFGLHTGQHQVTFAELRSLWRFAAEAGFAACYLFDHFQPLHSDVEGFLPEEATTPDGPCLEGFTALAALARSVPEIGIGLMVAGVGYRSAGMFGHMVATLAQAAPGRLEVGIGGGWFTPEYRAFGYPFPPAVKRIDELERALEALTAWFRGEAVTVPGVAEDASLLAVRPMPRLWVAGTGERRLLPLAARYADSWNAMYLTPEEFARKVEVLLERCDLVGRKPETLERSIALRAFCGPDGASARDRMASLARLRGRDPERVAARSLVGAPQECAEQLGLYERAGATHLTVMVHPPYDREELYLLATEVFPAFRGASSTE